MTDHVMSIRIPCNRLAPVTARDLTAASLEAWEFAGDRHGALLVVSELVTNAVMHGACDVTDLELRHDEGTLTIAVWDPGADEVVVRDLDHDRVGGLGLHVMDRVASAWGVDLLGGGKTVWAVLPEAVGGVRDRAPLEHAARY